MPYCSMLCCAKDCAKVLESEAQHAGLHAKTLHAHGTCIGSFESCGMLCSGSTGIILELFSAVVVPASASCDVAFCTRFQLMQGPGN